LRRSERSGGAAGLRIVRRSPVDDPRACRAPVPHLRLGTPPVRQLQAAKGGSSRRLAYAWDVPRLPFRIALFLSSYAPLFALLAWTNRGTTWVWLTLLIVAGLSVGALAVVFRSKATDVGPRLVVARSTPDEGEVMAYVSTYLLPFLGLDLSSATGIVAFLGFLVVVGVVYVNSNMLFVNPLLSLAGYHTFKVVDSDGAEYRLVTRRKDLEVGAALRPAQVGRYVRLEVRP
jgi:hypothetical protein